MELNIPELMVRRRIVLEGYLDFSKSTTSWDIHKNMLRKSSEMFVYCTEKKALICPAPRRRGVKEDGCIIAYNSGYIIGIGENEETCIEYIAWLRKKFRQHDPSVALQITPINVIFRIDISYKIGSINLDKLFNIIKVIPHNFEISYDPEVSAVLMLYYNGRSQDKCFCFPQSEQVCSEITECCYTISSNIIIISRVKSYKHANIAAQILITYLNQNEIVRRNQ
ncbi:uncharacterized protein CMU_014920 [Cryptosporidium muris RN66]|uniref:Uncharacterized protein n=1 Tax=Cryptosporidium muris (strain RN66) TaxID=441375 RepID=B6AF49_CRYMR|nr:uncharacterized protein CMU_014920 [Cryptosporidium muris RN66]EEA06816.1 hypothetical protein, conserved [Cryptosporidium muris RN66]|eukprot:XP_002141165.1 hypothetical protein [Cryptosporidium muris RN66]